MSFGIIAAGIGAAGSIAGGMMQSGGASDAAGTSAGQSAANAAALAAAGRHGDALLKASGAGANTLLAEGFQDAVKDMAPYDRLGLQGSNALASYLGFTTLYGKAKPTKPAAPSKATAAKPPRALRNYEYYRNVQRENESTASRKAAEDSTRYKRELAAYNSAKSKAKPITAKEYKNQLAQYKTDLAKWEKDRIADAKGKKAQGDFGAYTEPYGVKEPTYQQFTQKSLKADPIYQTELNENVRAWDQSAASRGSLMSGNTVAGLREMTASGIGRGRDRHLQDYGIRHDEWLGGYGRDWNQRERKYNAYAGLNNMGLGVRTGLANARMSTAGSRAGNTVQVGANRANTLMQGAGAQANYAQQGADARGTGQLAQGTAYGNAFGNIGSLGMLYGLGAFGNNGAKNGTYAGNSQNPMVAAFLR